MPVRVPNKKTQWGLSASDIFDQIGDLTAIGVGQGCGTGYPLKILHKRYYING